MKFLVQVIHHFYAAGDYLVEAATEALAQVCARAYAEENLVDPELDEVEIFCTPLVGERPFWAVEIPGEEEG